jgi:putative transposase
MVVPGLPHHVTQRGNRREAIFFEDGFLTELERRLSRPIARRAPGRKAVAIPGGEQLNLLQ